MSEVVSKRSAPVVGHPQKGLPAGPSLDGPHPPGSKRPSPRAPLAWASLVASLAGGPLGAVAAIVFGWVAVREGVEHEERGRRLSAMALAGMALGVIATALWGAAIALSVWSSRQPATRFSDAASALFVEPSEAPVAHAGPQAAPPDLAAETDAGVPIQKETSVREEGAVTVVDVGAGISSLVDELARQRAAAASRGQTVLVMTTRASCTSCKSLSSSLSEPLMQTALAGVRLVRVDVDAFADDLDGLRMQHERLPGFFLLSLDLSPRDAIDGGEWDEDVAGNVAPALGAFVRGKYRVRRQAFHPAPETGMRL